MKTYTCSALVALISVSVLSVQAAIDKPMVMDEAMLSITVSDLHGFLDEVGTVAAQVSPMMNGAMIKNMAGMQIGDPGLAGIPAGKGLSIVALDPTNIFAVIEVSEAQSAGYINMAQSQQLLAKYDAGVLLVAGTPEALSVGVAKSAKLKSALLAKRSATLQVAMQPATMIERNKDAIDGFLAMMPGLMGQSMMNTPGATLESVQTTAKILEGEMIVGLSLAKQCSALEIKLAPKSGAIQLSKTYVPKAGTGLATLMNAPVLNKGNAKINAGLLDSGAIMMDFGFANTEALGVFVAAEIDHLVKELKLENVDAAVLSENVNKWLAVYGSGNGCEMVNFGADGSMNLQYVMEVKDPEAALNQLKNMNEEMAPLFAMYEGFGMPMSTVFTENVRDADGVKIHTLAMDIEFGAVAQEQSAQIAAMGLTNIVYEVAVTDGLMLYSGAGEMEALIKRVKASTSTQSPLKARTVYPAGGFYYFDLDMGEYMAFASQLMPDSPEGAVMKQQLGTIFQGVDPITSAGFKQGGLGMWSVNIPGDLLAKYGQMIMMMQMQKMQQAPQGMPATMP